MFSIFVYQLRYCRYVVSTDRYHIHQLESCHNRQKGNRCAVESGFGENYNGKCEYKEKQYEPVRELMPLCPKEFFDKIGTEYNQFTNSHPNVTLANSCKETIRDLKLLTGNVCDCFLLLDTEPVIWQKYDWCRRTEHDM